MGLLIDIIGSLADQSSRSPQIVHWIPESIIGNSGLGLITATNTTVLVVLVVMVYLWTDSSCWMSELERLYLQLRKLEDTPHSPTPGGPRQKTPSPMIGRTIHFRRLSRMQCKLHGNLVWL